MKAKAAARFNGRRGGRFAEEGAEKGWQNELHRARLHELGKGPKSETNPKGGTWPIASLRAWAAIADVARARGDGYSPSPREAMALDVVETAKDAGWEW